MIALSVTPFAVETARKYTAAAAVCNEATDRLVAYLKAHPGVREAEYSALLTVAADAERARNHAACLLAALVGDTIVWAAGPEHAPADAAGVP